MAVALSILASMACATCALVPTPGVFENFVDPRTDEQVATLSGNWVRRIVDSDGKVLESCECTGCPSAPCKGGAYRLAPGGYAICYDAYGHGYLASTDPGLHTCGQVQLEAGHKYGVQYLRCLWSDLWKSYCTWERVDRSTMWLEDVTSGAVLLGDRWDE